MDEQEALRSAMRQALTSACAAFADQPVIYLETWQGATPFAAMGSEANAYAMAMKASKIFADTGVELLIADAIKSDSDLSRNLFSDAFGNLPADPTAAALPAAARFAFSFLRRYFEQTHAFVFASEVFEPLFDEAIRVFRSPNIRITTTAPLVNIRLDVEGAEIAPGLTIRRLQPDEVAHWADGGSDPLLRGFQFLLPKRVHEPLLSRVFPLPPECVVEYTHSQGRFDSPTLAERQPIQDLVTAIRILTDRCVTILVEQRTVEWTEGSGSGVSLTTIPIPSEPFVLTAEGVEHLRVLYKTLQRQRDDPRLELAVRRLRDSADRWSDEDKLIDYWIALEALFSPSNEGELSFRMSLRIAAFIEHPSASRKQVYEDMKRSYKWRSAIVHGNQGSIKSLSRPQNDPLPVVVTKTRACLREAVLKILFSDQKFDADGIDGQLLIALPVRSPSSENST